ncbi:ribosome recycling factor [Candidatus Curtissbacteria bacterium RIFCSPLOWO2_02_41_11]|uniref:Ribosome recycling factor n=2 Tax=Candidatus Curtissiibacteriota TaxID=1752717 RepID=A0A1F5HPH9_9BACT|nr:MAG: Ribosome-recycling factor [Candidatus Curtissbacteria bacterium GW2011_GWA2_41_24]OGD89530.1 MAG: ribosome recycling factor [Candidatus Curtissbacteria bacterium RIFCSPHIGHO2_02_39_8]OGE05963.1 MAG: ribosome recycling factor [Candidatus Curtissbacteria bacterium RIFCSPLOWO2_02_41_11]
MLDEATQKMQVAIGHLKTELAQIRTGRANVSLVSDISVDAYDSKLMIKELGQITTPEPTVLLISPWDKSIITNIVGGIAKANIGLNAVVDGDLVRIVIPPLTAERREQFIRQMHTILEKYRVEIRQIRHEFIEKLRGKKQLGEIGEDEEKRQKVEVQKLHDEFIEVIEVAGKVKEKELRQV